MLAVVASAQEKMEHKPEYSANTMKSGLRKAATDLTCLECIYNGHNFCDIPADLLAKDSGLKS